MRTRVNSGPQAAHRDIAAFAAVAARQRHAGNALHGFGEIAVGKLADVFGGDDIDGCRFRALLGQRGVQRAAETGDDNFFELSVLLAGLGG